MMEKRILFFDTETASLKGPIIQLAWVVTDGEGEVLECRNNSILPRGEWEMDPRAEAVHGISRQWVEETGNKPHDILWEFVDRLNRVDLAVAHNLAFDLRMVKNDIERYHLTDLTPQPKATLCTMARGTLSGQKWPKLEELHIRLFKKGFEGSHDALNDVMATVRIYFEMLRLGMV
jgi:DNA polymerase-3 subunit alpha/DNA polymerase-3 subunit epsilon